LPQPPTPEQLESFKVLKEALSSERFLVHDDTSIPVMIGVDASYEFGFGATVYQVPKDMMVLHSLTYDDLRTGNYDRRLERVIMFLSREITPAESRYWPTELETAGIVFAVQKSRHIIESNANTTIIFTDHAAVRQIAQAVSLKTASPERANMRLIRAAQYLSQFRLDVRYRPGKDNVVPDALSRLKRIVYHVDIFNIDNDIAPDIALPDYVATMIHLSPIVIDKWASTVKSDRHLYSIYKQLLPKLADDVAIEENKWVLKKVSGIPMLFVRKRNEGLRLCIPEGMHKDVLMIAHDNQGHAGIERTYSTLRDHFYIRQMGSIVRLYVSTCPQCLTKKTVRHKPYGRLQIIEAPHKPFHTVTIDFVVKLPLSKLNNDVYDTILTITDKLSRAVIFVPGKET
jgi:hypothetical protein